MLKTILFYLIQWTWGLPQNLAGLFLYAVSAGSLHSSYKHAAVTYWSKQAGLSMGMFIFLWDGAAERMAAHEYGHCIQSMILGPVYIPVVGIPSLLWCRLPGSAKRWNTGNNSYFSFFTEKWADRLGKVRLTEETEKICVCDAREG